MLSKKIIPGDKFGWWEVLGEVKTDKPGKYYECICACGKIRELQATMLRARRSTKCFDCSRKELNDPAPVIGKKFGHWTVLKYVETKNGQRIFKVKCKCGYIRNHKFNELNRKKRTIQCRVCHNRAVARNNRKHGMHTTKIYKVWCAMLSRCNNPNATAYKWYGARGIKVCDSWHKFENFYKDMNEQPFIGATLDRIDNDKDYKKSNCRWVTHQENCQNRSKRYNKLMSQNDTNCRTMH